MTAESIAEPLPAAPPWRPWKRGIAWLLFLGPFFFLSYGFANWWTATYSHPGAVVFAWETNIPFVAWTIIPYWSIDLFYGLSFLLCRSRDEVDRHARRLLGAQLIAIACFIAFPLRFSFEKPAMDDGIYSALYDALAGFDKPFNQAPSLHIALLVILWPRYLSASRGASRHLVHFWSILILVSVLTTYQHHFIDIPTGALLGLICLWLWPDQGSPPFSSWRFSISPERQRVGARYLLGAALCTLVALWGYAHGWLLWMLWPAVALLLVALSYFGFGPEGFQKFKGRHAVSTRWLLAPYTAMAWLNSRIWTIRYPQPVEIVDGIWLGRMPREKDMINGDFKSLLDLTAELSAPAGDWIVRNLPWLDLATPDTVQLRVAAQHIESLLGHGPVLVCCALGLSRSASAVAAWLLVTGRASSVDAAIEMISTRRPQCVLGARHREMLEELQLSRKCAGPSIDVAGDSGVRSVVRLPRP